MNGILLVDKPSGCTSHDVVRVARKVLRTKKVGHAGTLDPLASGLLLLLVGQATKLSDYLLGGDKGYEVEVLLGTETETQDRTGKVLSCREVDVSGLDIESGVDALTGEIELPIPAFSAVKVDGKKLYEYARAGEEAPRLTRISDFYDLQLLGVDAATQTCRIAMKCSKGSYVRSWVQALGEHLGCGATVNELRRNWSDPFRVSNAQPLAQLEMGEIEPGYLPMEEALPHWEIIETEGFDERLLLNGQISGAMKGYIFQNVAGSQGFDGRFRVISREDRHLVALLKSSRECGLEICRVFPRN